MENTEPVARNRKASESVTGEQAHEQMVRVRDDCVCTVPNSEASKESGCKVDSLQVRRLACRGGIMHSKGLSCLYSVAERRRVEPGSRPAQRLIAATKWS
jgi:hypothetical protein